MNHVRIDYTCSFRSLAPEIGGTAPLVAVRAFKGVLKAVGGGGRDRLLKGGDSIKKRDLSSV